MTDVLICVVCGEPIVEYRKAWQKVEGWSKVHRKGGGTNAVALRVAKQEFMCDTCMVKAKLFPQGTQEQMAL